MRLDRAAGAGKETRMDLKLLADALVIALTPVLPHLVTGGTEAVKADRNPIGCLGSRRVDLDD